VLFRSKFDNNRVTEIVEQRTTRDEILIMFGSPLQTNLADPNRASWWRYGYTHLGFLVVEQASLEIYFTDNLVDYYLFNVDRSRY
jgi:hypothetical protein